MTLGDADGFSDPDREGVLRVGILKGRPGRRLGLDTECVDFEIALLDEASGDRLTGALSAFPGGITKRLKAQRHQSTLTVCSASLGSLSVASAGWPQYRFTRRAATSARL